ncbi:hypothetical protein C8Q70DRAFT_914851 [Cubamyces menziesii]|nr:hypothetical protein C8Q70DRAFT_914851 [Cubamyces menziesii]
MPSKKFAELTSALPRRHTNLLIQLRTNHVPLQAFLERIGKVNTAICPTCGSAPETVSHYLLACSTYTLHRAIHFRPLGYTGRNLKTLLNSKDATAPLFGYINATGRLRAAFGSLEIPDCDASDSGRDPEDDG